VGTPHKALRYSSSKGGGTPHIPFEGICLDIQTRVGTPHNIEVQSRLTAGWLVGWLAGWLAQSVIIVPLRGSILQAETCQILSLAENPRWSPSVAKITVTAMIIGPKFRGGGKGVFQASAKSPNFAFIF